jgi:hypothetical protein
MATFIMTFSAVFLAGLGIVLNFAPAEIAGMLGFTGLPQATVTLQLLAGALLSLGIIDWMLRRSVSGIYGRPIGLGNLLFFGASAAALLRAANAGVLPSLTWTIGAVTGALAVCFVLLVFGGIGAGKAATC